MRQCGKTKQSNKKIQKLRYIIKISKQNRKIEILKNKLKKNNLKYITIEKMDEKNVKLKILRLCRLLYHFPSHC